MVAVTDELVSASALARTYRLEAYADPFECVGDYFDVLDYCARNPDAGRTAVGRALDLPPGRVRQWMNGSIPDCVRGIQSADTHGWLDAAYGDRVFRGLNVLVAWVFSGGSINRNWTPYFVPDDGTHILDRAAAAVDVELDFTRAASELRPQELRPVEHASVLGRVLHVLGAPVGAKNDRADIELPAYLAGAPPLIRREFIQTYLVNRMVSISTGITRFREDRSLSYLRSIAALIESEAGPHVGVSDKNVNIGVDPSAEIAGWPPLLDGV